MAALVSGRGGSGTGARRCRELLGLDGRGARLATTAREQERGCHKVRKIGSHGRRLVLGYSIVLLLLDSVFPTIARVDLSDGAEAIAGATAGRALLRRKVRVSAGQVEVRESEGKPPPVHVPMPSWPGACAAGYAGPDCRSPIELPCFGRAFGDRDSLTLNQVAASKALVNGSRPLHHPVLKSTLVEALPPLPFIGEDDTPFENCALVGNSPIILGKGWGPEIDSNDLVARCNNAPVKLRERDVGSWTSFRYQNERYSGYREKHTDSVIGRFCSTVDVKGMVFCPPGNDTAFDAVELTYMLKKKMHPLNPYFDAWIERPFRAKKTMPSTGMRALGVLLHICKHINLYGFGGTGNNFRMWYWEKYRGFKGKPPADILKKKYPKMLTRAWKHSKWTYAIGGDGQHKRNTHSHPEQSGGEAREARRHLLKAGVVQTSEHNHLVEENCFRSLEAEGFITTRRSAGNT